MGGQAFAKVGLTVPRMSPKMYNQVAADVQAKLASIFRNITIPREAPGKADYGDLDLLVEGSICPWTPASIQQALGATHHINHGETHTYAVPYTDTPNTYAQVDVEICPGNDTADGAELFEWTRLMKSDADLFQIIGICHRSLGLLCNDRGLHLRVEDIQSYDKKKSLLFLTRNPKVTLDFYGLDTQKYSAGFENESDLFDWVSRGRFFNRQIFERREEKANDRSRQKKRIMYSRFVEEYMPSHPEAGVQTKMWTRQEVLEEALNTFDKRDKYEVMMEEHRLYEKNIAIWEKVKETIPLDGNSLGVALKGMRRWVDFTDGNPYITSKPMIDEQPAWARLVTNEEGTLAWVKENWPEVKALEKARAAAAKEAGKK
jgi:hypothetical protein